MNRYIFFLLLAIVGLITAVYLLPIPFYPANPHAEIRAALDIGSGATNIKIARVDKQTDKIIGELFEKSIPVPYQKHLEKSSDNKFDNEVMQQGIKAVKELKDIADTYQVQKVVAVATAAFRQAENAPQFAKEIETQTGVTVHIINQDEEGILAFRGALAIIPIEPQNAIVWDIGGGSMQLTTLSETGSYLVEKGNTASIPFKNILIEKVKKQDFEKVHSPNPLNQEEIAQGLKYAQEYAAEVNPFIKEKIKNPNTYVVGVGNLLNKGILPIAGKGRTVTPVGLAAAVMKLENKTDKELPGGALAEVAVSNPMLVLGYMQGLDMRDIDIVNVNNTDGVLTYPAYWGGD